MLAEERLANMPLINMLKPATYSLTPPESEGEALYNDDEFGFRTWNIDYNLKHGKRFLFAGAFSMGYGYGVTAENTFTSVFYKEFNKLRPATLIEVINANKNGVSLSATFHKFRDVFFTEIKPDVVIIAAHNPLAGFPGNKGQSLNDRVFGDKRAGIGEEKITKERMSICCTMKNTKLWNYLYTQSLLMAKLLTYFDVKVLESACPLKQCDNHDVDYTGYLYDLHEFLSQHNWVASNHYSVRSHKLIGTDIATWANGILDDKLQLVTAPQAKSSVNMKHNNSTVELTRGEQGRQK
ncbi:MAG: hypothetical protein HY758_09110 [Nitrospirae bacterium]|nr:hypothetical protein [Nitrospirota bacterium]